MEIIERIYLIMNQTDKKAVDLCKVLNIQTSTMSTWKTRANDPPAKYMKRISEFLGCSLDYLLTGEELPAKKITTEDEDDMLELYRSLPDAKKYEFKGEIKGYLKALHECEKHLDKEKRLYG